jgi:hypothetical protein
MKVMMLATSLAIGLCACGHTLSEAQRAYNACTDSYNSKFEGLENSWAFVSGVGPSASNCYWSWGQGSVQQAIDNTTARCHEQFSRCFVYATNLGHSNWTQKISDNGGLDQDSSYANRTGDDAAAAALIGGALNGLARGYSAGSSRYTPTNPSIPIGTSPLGLCKWVYDDTACSASDTQCIARRNAEEAAGKRRGSLIKVCS